MNKRTRRNDKVYQNGQIVIKTLDIAVHLVRNLSSARKSDLTMQETCERIEEDLLSGIIELASVCCGIDDWDATSRYISESGVTLPDDLCARIQSLAAHPDFD
jgi:hypothetical protein